MLGIQRLKSLAEIVGFEIGELHMTAELAEQDVTELTVWHPTARKPRSVICVRGKLRRFQERLYHRRLKHRLRPMDCSFGGIAGRSALQNARRHVGNAFVYKGDIADFYPSIGIDRINRLFLYAFGCSPEVSRFLTRLCSYDHHLALGLVTSPILADQMLRQVDERILNLCERYAATYTRFVDDVTISAKFDIRSTPIPKKVSEILQSHGFRSKVDKQIFGQLRKGIAITGVRLKGNRTDAPKDYVHELERQLADHAILAAGGRFDGPLLSSSQLAGRVYHAIWLNPARRFLLLRRLKTIHWGNVWAEARQRALVFAQRVVTKRDAPEPSFECCYSGNAKPDVGETIDLADSGDECPFDVDEAVLADAFTVRGR